MRAISLVPRTISVNLRLITFVLALLIVSDALAQDRQTRNLREIIELTMKDLDVTPGLALAVVTEDKIQFMEGFGYANVEQGRKVTPETLFYIASTTKAFTGLTFAALHHDRELDLDIPIDNYISTDVFAEGLNAELITLRSLLTHTHGIANSGPVTFRYAFSGEYTNELLLSLIAEHPAAESGNAFRYGNIGYNLADLVMQSHLGTSWKTAVDEAILTPLGMSSTSTSLANIATNEMAAAYRLLPVGFEQIPLNKGDTSMHAAGGIISNLNDMSVFLQAVMRSEDSSTGRTFTAEVVEEALDKFVHAEGSAGSIDISGYALGWFVGQLRGRETRHSFGSFPGFSAHVSFIPESNIGLVVLSNSAVGGLLANVLALEIYEYYGAIPIAFSETGESRDAAVVTAQQFRDRVAEDLARRAARSQVLPFPLAAYAGVYANEELGWLVIDMSSGTLSARMGVARSDVEVYDNLNHEVRVELTGGGEVVRFEVLADTNSIDALVYRDRRFDRIR